ncbi:MAG: sulfide/dihydroorotate dehydrogenase-like FAD/NAD-binding protein [Spirochaetaceae bacterium]|nr:sulfide/dihydroorotate dehydrogenase-like FAD/NAD-binding protein [Spirochaetaceae bacterium]
MNKIIEKVKLSDDVFQMKIDAPLIAEERKAGQFIVLLIDLEHGERIPLTIAGADKKNGTITIIFQAVGDTTRLLAKKEEGDYIESLLGPLGTPTHIQKYDKPVVCVGGGIGVAPLRPIVQAFKEAGNEVISIIGARTKELLILEDEINRYSNKVIVCTDDGSYGRKDLVTAPLKEICESDNPPGEVIAIGPPIMMKFCALTTKPFNVHTTVSLNTIMVDGTGMCGGCRVTVGDDVKFVCVDGPEFDGHKVDFENMMNRLNTYKFQEDHECNIGLDGKGAKK